MLYLQCWAGGLKGKLEGSSGGLDVLRSIPFGAECLEAAKTHTENQNGCRVKAILLVEDLRWHLESPGGSTSLVEVHFYPCKPSFVSVCGSGCFVCCLLTGDAQF